MSTRFIKLFILVGVVAVGCYSVPNAFSWGQAAMYFAWDAWAIAVLLGITLGSALFLLDVKALGGYGTKQPVVLNPWASATYVGLVTLVEEGIFRLGVVVVLASQAVWVVIGSGMVLWLVWMLLSRGAQAWRYALVSAVILLAVTWYAEQIYIALVTQITVHSLALWYARKHAA